MSSHETIDPAFGEALARTGQALIVSLAALESAFRRLHPPDFGRIRPQLGPAHEELDDALGGLLALEAPQPLDAFRVEFVASAELARSALAGLVDPAHHAIARGELAVRRRIIGGKADHLLGALGRLVVPLGDEMGEGAADQPDRDETVVRAQAVRPFVALDGRVRLIETR